jgi:hypothetical protein
LKFFFKIFFISVLASCLNGAMQDFGKERISKEFPRNPSDPSPDFIKKNRFELGIDKNKVDLIRRQEKRYREILDGTYDISILQNPVFKVLKTVDTMYLHPNYTTLIILPKKYLITYGHASFKTKLFKISNNIVSVQPNRKFQDGNMVFYISDKRENFVISINVREYFVNLNCTKLYGNYKCSNEYFSTIYKYYNEPNVTLDERIEIVRVAKKKFGDKILYSKEPIQISYQGVGYKIVKSTDGDIFYKNQRIQVIPQGQ